MASRLKDSAGSGRPFPRSGTWGQPGRVECSIVFGGVFTLLATVWLAQKYEQVWTSWQGEVSEVIFVDPHTVNITRLESAVELGAVCLDGSPPAYYLDRGFGKGADNWLIHFEGGGWCRTAEECLNRAFTQLGSSRYMADEIYMGGILSSDPAVNRDFYDWNRVRFKYCDGGSFFGEVEEVVTVKQSLKNRYSERSAPVYYRGMRIWKAVMNDLLSKGMANAKQGFLTGCSAGGLASFLHCDLFKDLMPEGAKVKCMSDAGFFLHIPDISGAPTIETFYRDVVKLQNITPNLPKECTSSRDPAHCFFATYLLPLIKTPFFVLNPGYDNWQFYNVLVPGKADPAGEWEGCKKNLSHCTENQKTTVQGFRTELLKQLDNLVNEVSENPGNGAFINSCYAHCQLELDWSFSGNDGPKIEGKSIGQAVGEWYKGVKSQTLIDCPFPCNPTCSS
ncbi:hypothetical protein R1sor_006861 [Riccia sorocarpa]|uniref:Pectin acetylesterase n=1 Tax=Riccia sorocarpa TaxID=122646 RepID=A0ABD3HNT1_9MARC